MTIVAQLKGMNMTEIAAIFYDPDMAFFRYALITGLLASISFGIIGTFVVARRISYLAGAISHCVLGGIGAGLYFQYRLQLTWFDPIYGALAAALLAALVIGVITLRRGEREDTVIGAIWAMGMAVGLLFIAKTPGYVDAMSYLFGNILLISKTDIYLVAGLDVLVVGISLIFYPQLLAVCFDEEYARLRGLNTSFYFLLLLVLTALTVVLLVRVVGIVMVIALLTLPAAVASGLTRGLKQMMIVAIMVCMFCVATGLLISYKVDLPGGPLIITIAGACYLIVMIQNRFID